MITMKKKHFSSSIFPKNWVRFFDNHSTYGRSLRITYHMGTILEFRNMYMWRHKMNTELQETSLYRTVWGLLLTWNSEFIITQCAVPINTFMKKTKFMNGLQNFLSVQVSIPNLCFHGSHKKEDRRELMNEYYSIS